MNLDVSFTPDKYFPTQSVEERVVFSPIIQRHGTFFVSSGGVMVEKLGSLVKKVFGRTPDIFVFPCKERSVVVSEPLKGEGQLHSEGGMRPLLE